MARKLSEATIKKMQKIAENVTLFDVDLYFDYTYAEIVIYDDNCDEIHRTCVNTAAQLEQVIKVWQCEYEQFVFDYAETSRRTRPISQAVNDIKIKVAYDNATRILDEANNDFTFDCASQWLQHAEDLVWIQWQECN